MHIHEEASAVKNSDRGWQSPSFSWLKLGGMSSFCPHLGEGLSSCKTQGLYQIMYLFWGGTKTWFSMHYYLTALSLFLCSFVSLRSLITEIYPRASIVTRLRSQKWLRPKWLLLCQKRYSWFSFFGDSLTYVITEPYCCPTSEDRSKHSWWLSRGLLSLLVKRKARVALSSPTAAGVEVGEHFAKSVPFQLQRLCVLRLERSN